MKKLDTILLIDDDDVANYINQDLLSELQVAYSIPVASNGREGLDYLKKNILKKNYNFSSLILLDMKMPVMNGYEFLIHFNNLKLQSGHDMDVAILSSEKINEPEKIKNLGVSICLEKPLTEEKILEVIDEITHKKPNHFREEMKSFREYESKKKANPSIKSNHQIASAIGIFA